MTTKKLFVYNLPKLFEILKELKEYLNFEIHDLDQKDYEKSSFKEVENYLIITNDLGTEMKNSLVINKKPEKISKLIELINIRFLSNQFNNQSKFKIGKYTLDINSRKIYFDDISVNLTEKESALILFINTNKKVKLKELQKEVCGHSSDLETHTVETNIYRLRKKILKSFRDDNFIKYDKKGYYLN